ncbi:two-component hybrid sensor and regulator, chemotaxis family, sensor kinase (plasmid) [Azospirillum sp. B510]|uniref:hybrid sensor histidine kinase/response regulator n=1 Tax=Azospirillum sp. (strain B510) TaxID=137722 RepID=UPI0001C4C888|nr:chemotaxis protein CheW [Azospirillum sp. B510]BAI76131.1 two-component hybrid sensor and regulator, chemotaxis family, sensor kinase [Azospirillum sp. B510]
MDDLLSEFLTETNENLSVLDVELVRLEQNPNNPELLSNIFRLVHTIKGTCGFLGLPRLEKVAHASENVLGKFRDGELTINPEAVSLILQALDTIKSLLAVLEATEAEPPGDDLPLIERLNLCAEGKLGGPAPAAAAPPPPPPPPTAPAVAAAEERPASLDDLEALWNATPGPNDAPAAPAPAAAPAASTAVATRAPAPVEEPSHDLVVPEPEPAAAKMPAPVAPMAGGSAGGNAGGGDAGAEAATKESAVAAQTIRVNVDLLENLMTMVSELVLTRNQLLQILRSQKESEFAAPLQRLNHVTSELQEGVMKTRMQPIGNAWAKLPRLVRDLAHELNKKIDLQMLGADTELDRQVLELIKDPLTHMVRNSADHGLEIPAERVKAGKTETGRITLNAYHEGGHIIIEIQDDGKGLAIDRIKQKAIQNGMASEIELASMTDQQIIQFIMKPGFSTAAKVTNVSGRGVGMDVVKTNIEKIGGTIEIKSAQGKGSTFIIKIPLTLAIVSALIVECAGERFAIPQISVVELVRAASDSEHTIERLKGTPVLRLRNRLLPLVSLQQLLRLDDSEDAKKPADETFIVVTQVGTYTFGIMVDRVFDTEEIVVKPVAPILRHIEMFSGNTILGDGSVIMILDPNGIASATGEMAMGEAAGKETTAVQTQRQEDKMALLLFRAGEGAPKAVPLSLVARLEDVDLASVELSNGLPVVQYRGKLMPLVPIDPNFMLGREGRQPVLVFADGDRSMGLIVDEIVDIVEEKLNVQLAAERPGLMGSAIIAGKATEVIDAGFFLTQAYKDWFGSSTQEGFEEEKLQRVLLVDDSPFFRNLLTPLLSVAGYDVTAVENASDALALCEAGEDFDVIVSDIEMPGMSGFDFAEAVRHGSRWQGVPMVALSSHASARDLDRGRIAGFNDYVAKFDRDALLFALQQTLTEQKGAA